MACEGGESQDSELQRALKASETGAAQDYFSGAVNEKPQNWKNWSPAKQASHKNSVKQQKFAYVRAAGFAHYPQQGDGNCLFRSIADQLEAGSHNRDHRNVRRLIMDQVEKNSFH